MLKVTTTPLPMLKLSSSANISVATPSLRLQSVRAGQTVTAGIVSARGRTLETIPYIDFYKPTQRSLWQLRGPLLSTDGMSWVLRQPFLSPTAVGGAWVRIPAETVASVVGELEAHGRVIEATSAFRTTHDARGGASAWLEFRPRVRS